MDFEIDAQDARYPHTVPLPLRLCRLPDANALNRLDIVEGSNATDRSGVLILAAGIVAVGLTIL